MFVLYCVAGWCCEGVKHRRGVPVLYCVAGWCNPWLFTLATSTTQQGAGTGQHDMQHTSQAKQHEALVRVQSETLIMKQFRYVLYLVQMYGNFLIYNGMICLKTLIGITLLAIIYCT